MIFSKTNKFITYLCVCSLTISAFLGSSIPSYAEQDHHSENVNSALNNESNPNAIDSEKNENTTNSNDDRMIQNTFMHYAQTRGFVTNINPLHCGLKNNNCVQTFTDNKNNIFAVYGNKDNILGDVKLTGAIGKHWITSNWENSQYGYPTNNEKQLTKTRWSQEFENSIIFYERGKGITTINKNHPITTQYYTPNKNNLYPTNNLKCGLKNNGCVQSFIDNNGTKTAAYYHNNNVTPITLDDEIIKFWAKNNWENSQYGYPTSAKQNFDNGYYYTFDNNTIIYQSGNITILDKNVDIQQYLATMKNNKNKITEYYKTNKQKLGTTTTSIKCGLKNNGCVQSFTNDNEEKYAIYSWTNPTTNTNNIMNIKLTGAIGKHWITSNWENSQYGYPTNNEKQLTKTRWSQEFENSIIFYERGKGITTINKNHPITTQYYTPNKNNLYPTNNLKCGLKNNGCVQSFIDNNGTKTAAYYHNNNVIIVKLDNPSIRKWADIGWENSYLGYPIKNTTDSKTTFENGNINGNTITINDKIKAFNIVYNQSYKNYSIVRPLRCNLADGGCVATVTNNLLEDKAIYVTPRNGIVPVELESKVGKTWAGNNWENGRYGYPIEREFCNNNFCSQKFEKGSISQAHTTYMNLPFVNQIANGAPMGCEGASLLQALYYFGKYNGNLRQLLNSQPYSPDPWNPTLGFAGTPFRSRQNSYGGFFPHKFTPWANNFGVKAVNISHQGIEQIKKEIRRGNPVVYWGTYGFVPVRAWRSYHWGISATNEHVITIDGYQNGMFHITDPAYARGPKFWISEALLRQNYQIYKFAVAIRNK